jgi:peptidoglycan/xylan/chitin deacetylase (PgdA/CDA1 family)
MSARKGFSLLTGCIISVLVACSDSAPPAGDGPTPDSAGTADLAARRAHEFTLTVAATGDGATFPAPGTYRLPAGTRITAFAFALSGSTFLGWSGAATGTTPVTVAIDGDTTLTAQFSWGRSAVSGLPNVPQRDVPRPHGPPKNLRVLDWAGFKGAVTYSLDDSQPSHVEHMAELTATGIHMTFYVNEDTAMTDLPTWRQAFADGHEIGNHTVDHCNAPTATQPLLSGCSFGPDQPNAPAGATPESEIDDNTAWIKSEIGQRDVWTMATPFGDTNWLPFARPRFLLNRDVFQGFVGPNDGSDPAHLPCFMAGAVPFGGIDDQATTFNQLIDTARTTDKWLIFLFHSILPTAEQWFGLVDISQIVASTDHIKALRDVWADTMISVGAYWRAQTVFTQVAPRTRGRITTWSWDLPDHFPPRKFLRVTVDGGTLLQNGRPLVWDHHGYYEVALDKGSVTLIP